MSRKPRPKLHGELYYDVISVLHSLRERDCVDGCDVITCMKRTSTDAARRVTAIHLGFLVLASHCLQHLLLRCSHHGSLP